MNVLVLLFRSIDLLERRAPATDEGRNSLSEGATNIQILKEATNVSSNNSSSSSFSSSCCCCFLLLWGRMLPALRPFFYLQAVDLLGMILSLFLSLFLSCFPYFSLLRSKCLGFVLAFFIFLLSDSVWGFDGCS